jgi:hypothetical protein
MKIYLSSPFEAGRVDPGWKDVVLCRLRGIDERFEILDPCPDNCEEQSIIDSLKELKNWEALTAFSAAFVECDFAMMRQCVGMIAYLPYGAVTFGTTHEIIKALEVNIPIVLVMPEGKEKVAAWLWGILGTQRIFDDLETAVTTLADRVLVAQGKRVYHG